jgi:hypothetical protein
MAGGDGRSCEQGRTKALNCPMLLSIFTPGFKVRTYWLLHQGQISVQALCTKQHFDSAMVRAYVVDETASIEYLMVVGAVYTVDVLQATPAMVLSGNHHHRPSSKQIDKPHRRCS